MKISFSGHRPNSLPFKEGSDDYMKFEKLLWQLIFERMEQGYDEFYCGMARGIDIICGEIVLAEKATMHPDVRLMCVSPFPEHGKAWALPWRMRSQALVDAAAQCIVVSDHYFQGCYHQRNRYLVDHCDTLIAVYNGTQEGGTAYTVDYAKKQGKEIVILNPIDLSVSIIAPQQKKNGEQPK